MGRCRKSAANNQGILVLATLASIQIAQGLDIEQIETLAAFFEVLGDNLELLAAPPCFGSSSNEEEDTED